MGWNFLSIAKIWSLNFENGLCNFTPQLNGCLITYSCWDWCYSIVVKCNPSRRPSRNKNRHVLPYGVLSCTRQAKLLSAVGMYVCFPAPMHIIHKYVYVCMRTYTWASLFWTEGVHKLMQAHLYDALWKINLGDLAFFNSSRPSDAYMRR